jgi:hypothetical protein
MATKQRHEARVDRFTRDERAHGVRDFDEAASAHVDSQMFKRLAHRFS